MQEDFIHYVWKYQKFKSLNLQTTGGSPITIIKTGDHNHNSGPDFFNARIRIDDQLWAGNVELHLKASDWYIHDHHKNQHYNNVILHVVWVYDKDVYRDDLSIIPTLELKEFVPKETLSKYRQLMANIHYFINCEKDIGSIPSFHLNSWLDRLFVDRLEGKSLFLVSLLNKSNNDWESVLFKLLAKYFGLRVNSDAFFTMANNIDFRLIRKIGADQLKMEALFYGQFKLLEKPNQTQYYKDLRASYNNLVKKYKLDTSHLIPLKFFRMRPSNFPTIRLSQLAALYSKKHNIFSEIIEAENKERLYDVFDISASPFWTTHYTFNKSSKPSIKGLSKSFKDLLILNVVLPIKFCYSKVYNSHNFDHIVSIAETLKPERNQLVDGFKKLLQFENNAYRTQGLIELKNNYCDKNKCTKCALGHRLMTFKGF